MIQKIILISKDSIDKNLLMPSIKKTAEFLHISETTVRKAIVDGTARKGYYVDYEITDIKEM